MQLPFTTEQFFGVFRAYNNGFGRNASNHRYTANGADYDGMVADGWTGEGPVFCVPR